MEQTIIITAAVIILIIVVLLIIRWRKNRYFEPEIMEGDEFESFCANLLEKNGFTHIKQTPASHDFGCDIIAHKDGITYGIQCKGYSTPVGVSAVQQAYAGKDFYDCMVGVVMTNNVYTLPAIEAASKLKVVLWDGEDIEKLEKNTI